MTRTQSGLMLRLAILAFTLTTGSLAPAAYAQEDEQDPGMTAESEPMDTGGGDVDAADSSDATDASDDAESSDQPQDDVADTSGDSSGDDEAGSTSDADAAAGEAEAAPGDDDAADTGEAGEESPAGAAQATDESADLDSVNGEADTADAGDDVPEPAVYMTEDWAAGVVVDESNDSIQTDRTLDPTGQPWVVVAPNASNAAEAPSWARANRPGRGDYAGKSYIPMVQAPAPGSAPAGPGGKDTAHSLNGKPVVPGSAPWQAQLYASLWKGRNGEPVWRAQHECGGALIAKDWVVTAAHCIDVIVKTKSLGWRVRLGAKDISKEGDGVTYLVDRWVRHAGYLKESLPKAPPNMYWNDIGLLHIKADAQTRLPAGGKPIAPVQLYAGPVGEKAEVMALGWGMTGSVAKSFSALLMKVDLVVMDNDLCMRQPGYGPERINPTVMCAAAPRQKTCQGDSGGPVILSNRPTQELVGLVSWGKDKNAKEPCTGDGEPSVFTRIQSHLGWIQAAMKLDPTRSSLP